VPLSAALSKVALPLGEDLRGGALVTTVRAESADGHRVAFSAAEIDPALGGTEACVAFEIGGKPLPEAMGPFRLVVPSDRRGARWVRKLARLAVQSE
jgi:hypothetical protein